MSLKAVPATIQSGSVSIADGDDATKKAAVVDEAPATGVAALAARVVSGGEDANLSHELLYRILSELREANGKGPLPGCD